MKIGDLAYAKNDLGEWTEQNSWMTVSDGRVLLGIIIECRDLMVAVLNPEGEIEWLGRPGIEV